MKIAKSKSTEPEAPKKKRPVRPAVAPETVDAEAVRKKVVKPKKRRSATRK